MMLPNGRQSLIKPGCIALSCDNRIMADSKDGVCLMQVIPACTMLYVHSILHMHSTWNHKREEK